MRLFHFSDDPGIVAFEPRPVRIPSARAPGREWLNGPLVWAIGADHDFMYLFPRDCPAWPRVRAIGSEPRSSWARATPVNLSRLRPRLMSLEPIQRETLVREVVPIIVKKLIGGDVCQSAISDEIPFSGNSK